MGACERVVFALGVLSFLSAAAQGADNATTASDDASAVSKERHRRLIPYMTFYYSGQQYDDQPRYQQLNGGTSYSSQSLKPHGAYLPLKPSPQIPYPASGPATNVRFVQLTRPSNYEPSQYATNSVYSSNNVPYSAKYNQGSLKVSGLAPGWAIGNGNRYSTVAYSAKYNQGRNLLPISLANNAITYNSPYSAKYNREENQLPQQLLSNDAQYPRNENFLPQIMNNDAQAQYNHKEVLLGPVRPKYTVPSYANVPYSSKYNDDDRLLQRPDRVVENAPPPVFVQVDRLPAELKRPPVEGSRVDTLSQILDLLRAAGRLPPDVAAKTPVYRVSAPAPTTPKPVQNVDDDDYAYYDDDVDVPIPKSQANIKLTPLKPPFGTSTQAFPQSKGGTPGKPGVDYPILATIPETGFDCKRQRYKGFFGDPDTNCQVWHYCDLNGGQASFLCPNGTIFSQVGLTCDWWFNVRCESTVQLYVLNERLYKYILPVTPSFPEDYSGPVVDRYLTLKFQEKEEKRKQKESMQVQNKT